MGKFAGISVGWLCAFDTVIMIGMFNFGYGMASWNSLQTPFALRHQWDEETATYWATIVTTGMTVGGCIGALTAGYMMSLADKRTLILCSNALLIAGSGLTLIDNMYLISVGRLLYGVAIGHFSVYCPCYMNDLVPPELKGPMAGITNIQVCLGILAPFIFGYWIPEKVQLEKDV